MVLQNGLIPPQANLSVPNTKIDWDKSLLMPVMETTQLPQRAAVASYGYGGTVSHAVIESAPSQSLSIRSVQSRSPSKEPAILLLSAPSSSRIRVAASELARFLGVSQQLKNNEIDLRSIPYSLAVKRGHHKYRIAMVADSPCEAVKLLNEVAQSRENPHVFSGRAATICQGKEKGSVWVFSGHGAQWNHMGLALLEEPAFAEIVQVLEPIIEREMGFSASTAMRSVDFESTDKIQILTYVMQVGLAAVLRTRGLQPQSVIGHSHGEIAASVVAGALTLTEGAVICAVRARLYRRFAGTGAMILINIPYTTAVQEIGERTDIAVAIDSSPSSCVVSGAREAIKNVSVEWTKRGVQVRIVQSDTAFHSPMLWALVEPLQEALKGVLRPKEPRIPLYSTSDSDPRTAKLRDVDYWTNNMMSPVRLTSSISAAVQDGLNVFSKCPAILLYVILSARYCWTLMSWTALLSPHCYIIRTLKEVCFSHLAGCIVLGSQLISRHFYQVNGCTMSRGPNGSISHTGDKSPVQLLGEASLTTFMLIIYWVAALQYMQLKLFSGKPI